MPHDILENVWRRYLKASEILRLEDKIIKELLSFKGEYSADISGKVGGKDERLKAIRVWHRGPLTDCVRKGGNRYMKGITVKSLKSHAAEMSIKCLEHELPYAGAKGGVAVDPDECAPQELEDITYTFVDELNERRMIGPFLDVPAPDIGTNQLIMFWMAERYKYLHRGEACVRAVVTGKPVKIENAYVGGIHGRTEATGFGLNVALDELKNPRYSIINLGSKPTMAIQGFGNVGIYTALFAHQKGYRIIAIADKFGGVFNGDGLDLTSLIEHTKLQKPSTVAGFRKGEPITNAELFELSCDVLAPCAMEEVITPENAGRINAKVILEGANGPTTPEADEILENNNIVVIPDIYANSQGVVTSFFEWAWNTNYFDPRLPVKNDKNRVLGAGEVMMRKTGAEIVERKKKYNVSLRLAAYILALEKVELMRIRRIPEYAVEILK